MLKRGSRVGCFAENPQLPRARLRRSCSIIDWWRERKVAVARRYHDSAAVPCAVRGGSGGAAADGEGRAAAGVGDARRGPGEDGQGPGHREDAGLHALGDPHVQRRQHPQDPEQGPQARHRQPHGPGALEDAPPRGLSHWFPIKASTATTQFQSTAARRPSSRIRSDPRWPSVRLASVPDLLWSLRLRRRLRLLFIIALAPFRCIATAGYPLSGRLRSFRRSPAPAWPPTTGQSPTASRQPERHVFIVRRLAGAASPVTDRLQAARAPSLPRAGRSPRVGRSS